DSIGLLIVAVREGRDKRRVRSSASPDDHVTLEHDPAGCDGVPLELVGHATDLDGRHAGLVEAQPHGLRELNQITRTDGSQKATDVIEGDARAEAVHGDPAVCGFSNTAASKRPN